MGPMNDGSADRTRHATVAARHGSEQGREKLARQGKLPTRERIALLLDDGTFVEDGLLANATAEGLPADGGGAGRGAVDSRPVGGGANDPTGKAGAWGGRAGDTIGRA